MKKFYPVFLLILMLAMLSIQANGYAAGETSTQSLQTFVETMRGMDFPIEDAGKHEEKVQKADAYVDLESMAKKALGPHWAEASAEQQQAFMKLLWKLIENIAYPRSKAFLGALPIEYAAPESKPEGVEIKTTVKNQDEALNAEIIYDLYEKENGWKIYDIFLDGVSITEDLKFQFDKIIQDSKFPGLLQKMQERLVKAEQENKKK
jgi:phospholipid transport system substrate-binding protein